MEYAATVPTIEHSPTMVPGIPDSVTTPVDIPRCFYEPALSKKKLWLP